MDHQLKPFKRLNFFTGFFTTADDWNDGESYHLEKRKLHNRALHRAGILSGVGDELAVEPDGQLNVKVKPGAALDGYGNLLLFDAVKPLPVTPPSDTAQTAYITIRFSEKDDSYEEDPDFSGYKRKLENPLVECRFDEPDGVDVIELARISLAANASTDKSEIMAPSNPAQPGANEVDRTHARFAGARDPYFAAIVKRMVMVYRAIGDRQRRHNRGLHTPGVLHKIAGELRVRPAGGLKVCVEPGAALDGEGNELYLAEPKFLTLQASTTAETTHFVVATYVDPFGEALDQAAADETLDTLNLPLVATHPTAALSISTAKPDNDTQIALARIVLSKGATEIKEPADPDHPAADEIDMAGRIWSAARALAPERLDTETQTHVNSLMIDCRENVAALAARFFTPSMKDVRTAALQVRLMLGALAPDQLPRLLHVLADLELDMGEELAARYPPLVAKPEFRAYQKAVADLLAALDEHQAVEALLNDQGVVNSAVRDLAEVVFPLPVADAGKDQTAPTSGNHALVELDGSGSTAAEGQRIVRYIWKEAE